MQTVYKYPLFIGAGDDNKSILLPKGATILSAALDSAGQPVIYALVDTDRPNESRRIRVAGTGHPLDDNSMLRYVGTIVQGPFSRHVFEHVEHTIFTGGVAPEYEQWINERREVDVDLTKAFGVTTSLPSDDGNANRDVVRDQDERFGVKSKRMQRSFIGETISGRITSDRSCAHEIERDPRDGREQIPYAGQSNDVAATDPDAASERQVVLLNHARKMTGYGRPGRPPFDD